VIHLARARPAADWAGKYQGQGKVSPKRGLRNSWNALPGILQNGLTGWFLETKQSWIVFGVP